MIKQFFMYNMTAKAMREPGEALIKNEAKKFEL